MARADKPVAKSPSHDHDGPSWVVEESGSKRAPGGAARHSQSKDTPSQDQVGYAKLSGRREATGTRPEPKGASGFHGDAVKGDERVLPIGDGVGGSA